MRTLFCLLAFSLCLAAGSFAQSWRPVNCEAFVGIAGLSDGTLAVIRAPGDILLSNDRGGTWHEVHRGLRTLTRIQSLPDGDVIAHGLGELLLSRDTGRSWSLVDSGDDAQKYNALLNAGERSAELAGERGRGRTAPREIRLDGATLLLDDSSNILLTRDGGASWRRVLRMRGDRPRKLESISLIGSVCYVVGEPGLMYVSDSGFEIWREIHVAPFWSGAGAGMGAGGAGVPPLPQPPLPLGEGAKGSPGCIDFLSPSTGVISHDNQIYITRDSGTTWCESILPSTASITALLPCSDSSAIVGGANGMLTLTAARDGRAARYDSVLNTNRPVVQIGWKNRTMGDVYVLTDSALYFANATLSNLSQASVPLRPGEYARSASFPDNYMGYLVADSVTRFDSVIRDGGIPRDTIIEWDTTTVYRTSDGGASWMRLTTGLASVSKLWFVTAKRGFACGPNGVVLRTDDSGLSWSRSFIPTRQNLHDIRFVNDSTGYVCGDSGVVLVTYSSGRWWRQDAPEPLYSHPSTCYTSLAFPDAHTVYALGDHRCYVQTIRDPFQAFNFRRRRPQQKSQLTVTVNPNPTAGMIHITITAPTRLSNVPQTPTITISDVSGRAYDEVVEIVPATPLQWSASANLSELPVGAYTVTATLGDALGLCKVLISH